MKIYILTGSDGKIIGTVRSPESGDFIISPDPLPGQELHELELPKELEQEYDAEKLHRQLAQLLEDKTDQDKDLVS